MVGNSRFQKKANRALILNYLHYKGPNPRNILAKELGLQPSTVTNIVQELIKETIVVESEFSSKKNCHSSGRRPVMIELSPRYGCMIGLDLQVDYYVTVVYDPAGKLIKSEKGNYRKKSENSDFKTLLTETVGEIEKSIDTPVLGLGLALPGIIDSGSNRIVDCWTHKLKECHLSSWLKSVFPFPVIIENDANCAAFNHLNKMTIQNKRDRETSFIYLLPRFHNPSHVPENQPAVGVGMGFVLNGKLYRGAHHRAGEYQSILTSREHPYQQLSLSRKELSQARESKEIQKAIAAELINSMKLILQIFDPHTLIIGGDLAEIETREGWLKEGLQKKCPVEVKTEPVFDPAEGACALVSEQFFAIPQIGMNNKEM